MLSISKNSISTLSKLSAMSTKQNHFLPMGTKKPITLIPKLTVIKKKR